MAKKSKSKGAARSPAGEPADGVQRKPERAIVQVRRPAPPAQPKNSTRTAPSRPALPVVEVMTAAGPIDKVSNEGIQRIEAMQQLQDDVFQECLEGCQDQLAAFDLDPEALDEIPEHWKTELKDELAVKRRHAIAKAALLPSRVAPAALETMRSMVAQTIRAQAKEGIGGNVHKLNVAVVVGGVKHEYTELEIGPEEE